MSWEIIHSDCLAALKAMPDASVDSVVCDPPYGLGTREPSAEDLIAYLQGAAIDHGGDFMGKDWQIPPVAVWRECLRVLRPGGFLLAFAGTRTVELIAIGIRAAGFERRDTLAWVHAQGFPKSLSIDKAIDDAAGAKREEAGVYKRPDGTTPSGKWSGWQYNGEGERVLTAPATPDAVRWQGFGTALKPAFEPVIMARKPPGSTIAECVLKHGTGAINVDACRVRSHEEIVTHGQSVEAASTSYAGFPGGLETHQTDGQKLGRWPSNLVISHVSPSSCPCAELTPDREPIPGCRACGGSGTLPGCVRKGTKRIDVIGSTAHKKGHGSGGVATSFGEGGESPGYRSPDGTEEVEAWECVEGCPVAELDRQSGLGGSGDGPGVIHAKESIGYGGSSVPFETVKYGDSGGASRFFPTFSPDPLDDVAPFFYSAKAARSEREDGCEGLEAKTGAEAVDREEGSAGTKSPRAGAGRTVRLDTSAIVSYPSRSWVVAVLNRRLQADTARSAERAIAGSTIRSSDDSEWSMCWCGSPTTDPSHPAIRSIIETETSWTTESPTLRSSLRQHTNGCIAAAFGATVNGGSLAGYAEFSSSSQRNTSTSAKRGTPSTDDAEGVTSIASWLMEGPGKGGGRRVGIRNSHPT